MPRTNAGGGAFVRASLSSTPYFRAGSHYIRSRARTRRSTRPAPRPSAPRRPSSGHDAPPTLFLFPTDLTLPAGPPVGGVDYRAPWLVALTVSRTRAVIQAAVVTRHTAAPRIT